MIFIPILKEAFDVIIIIPRPQEGRGSESGNYFSIRMSVNLLPYIDTLLTGNDSPFTFTTLGSQLLCDIFMILEKG